MEAIGKISEPGEAVREAGMWALPLRLRLAELWTGLMRAEVAGASTSGELGTIANLEQRSRVHQRILTRHDADLAQLLGCDLPMEAAPARTYEGSLRIIVPAVRTSAAAGEALRVRVVVASAQDPGPVTLFWRPMGGSGYRRSELSRLGRHVYEAALPALEESQPAIEYHIEAAAAGEAARWPVSDTGLNQTVILGSQG
jgi:hypothetical protein